MNGPQWSVAAAARRTVEGGRSWTPCTTSSSRTERSHGRDLLAPARLKDECGGTEGHEVDAPRPFGDRRGTDRSGLGLGRSISRKAVRANGGEIHGRNLPGKGCVIAIELPLATPLEPRA